MQDDADLEADATPRSVPTIVPIAPHDRTASSTPIDPPERVGRRDQNPSEAYTPNGHNSNGCAIFLAVVFGLAACVFIVIGIGLVVYFFAVYDTSVPQYPGGSPVLDRQFRVHNIGRMQDRQMGLWAGVGGLIVGIACLIVATLFTLASMKSSRR